MSTLLAIESSCDETAVAILRGVTEERPELLASEISSQIELHRVHGGVVPELASRNHSLRLEPLVQQALAHANLTLADIDVFAATAGPGLASSLLIGSTAAKALAAAAHRPYIAVNHLEGHLVSPFLETGSIPPHLALIVSGGHTMLLEVAGTGQYTLIGRTRDDAAGEAFDKVAKMLGLPYPGGPEIEKAAQGGDVKAFDFPRSMMHESNFDFSFSGLKTAVLYTLAGLDPEHGRAPEGTLPDLCASFQAAVIEVLVTKTIRAAKAHGHTHIAVSGGVSLNRALRDAMEAACTKHRMTLHVAPAALTTDNAAMIAFAALLRHHQGERHSLLSDIDPNLPLVSA